MRNKYYTINGKRTFAKVCFGNFGVGVEVYIRKKHNELTTRHGNWREGYKIKGVRLSADGRTWIVTMDISFREIGICNDVDKTIARCVNNLISY